MREKRIEIGSESVRKLGRVLTGTGKIAGLEGSGRWTTKLIDNTK